MTLVPILLVFIGAFYVFAGIVAARATLTSNLMDVAIAAIAAKKPSRVETAKALWLLSAANLVLAGGLALALRLDIAAPLFVLSALGQFVYLTILAPRYFDAEDPPDAAGRRQSTNAAVLYTAATAFVVWAWGMGHLKSVASEPWLALAAGLAVAVHLAWNATTYMRSRKL